MNPELWKRVEQAFEKALTLKGDDRTRYLGQIGGNDPELAAALARLLAADEADDNALRERISVVAKDLASDQDDPWEGRQLGPYTITRRIASGGMGTVFLAHRSDETFEQRVAIKIMGAQMLAPDAVARFKAERQILANLSHRHIAKLYDGGTTDTGLPYLVMEYVAGVPIDQYCDEQRLGIGERLALFKDVCESVEYAHRNLVVHRDIKPSNILVNIQGEPKLLDFGIAKLLDADATRHTVAVTRQGMQALSPDYASPEQVRGEPVTTATDVYSLGVLLYKILSGRLPYQGRGAVPGDIIRAILEEEPSRPSMAVTRPTEWKNGDCSEAEIGVLRGTSVSKLKHRLAGDLDNIVLTTLRKDPERRYPSVRALSLDVDNYLAHRPVSARADSIAYRFAKYARRHRIGLAITVAVAIMAVVSLIQIVEQRNRATAAATESEQVTEFLVHLFDSASPFQSRGETPTAVDLLETGVSQIAELDGQPDVQARLYQIMASSLASLGSSQRAVDLAAEALRIRQSLPGQDPLLMADSLHELAEAQRLNNELEQAEQNFRAALEIRLHELGTPDGLVAQTWGRIGTTLQGRQRYAEARDALETALAMKRQLGQESDEDAIDFMGNLANTLDSLGHYDESIALHLETVALSKAVSGETNPNTIIRISNLGLLYVRTGRYEHAVEIFDEALALGTKVWPEDHPSIAFTTGARAATLKRLGRFDESLAGYQAAAHMTRTNSGEDSIGYAARLRGLGSVQLDMGDFEGADATFAQALALADRIDGPDSRQSAILRMFIGQSLIERDRFEEADAVLRLALAQQDKLSASTYQAGRRELAVSLGNQGRFDEAESILLDVLADRELALGPDSPVLIEYLTATAAHYRLAGQPQRALPLAERAYQLGNDSFSDGNWMAGLATAEYGRVLQSLGNPDEAGPLFAEAYDALLETFGPDDYRVKGVAEEMTASGITSQ